MLTEQLTANFPDAVLQAVDDDRLIDRVIALIANPAMDVNLPLTFAARHFSGGCGLHRRTETMFMPATNRLEGRNWPEDSDAAKTLFMTEVTRLVAEGRGELVMLESGMLELRLKNLAECIIWTSSRSHVSPHPPNHILTKPG